MKTLIFGPGYLGQRLATSLDGAVLSKADITDKKAIEAAINEHQPDAVINAAGKTGRPNVDWCESHQHETYLSNVVGPMLIADACARQGAHLLHLASGCIFYGPSPQPGGWREDDFANPSAFYSRSKYAADLVLSRLPNVAIARLRMPIDDLPGDRNLITKLSRYRQVVDVENSVTVVEDLIHVVQQLSTRKLEGVFHVTNPGTMRHRDLLALYRELVDPSHSYTLISEQELVGQGLAVKARSNCILASGRLAEAGITMRPVEVALRACVESYARAIRRLGVGGLGGWGGWGRGLRALGLGAFLFSSGDGGWRSEGCAPSRSAAGVRGGTLSVPPEGPLHPVPPLPKEHRQVSWGRR